MGVSDLPASGFRAKLSVGQPHGVALRRRAARRTAGDTLKIHYVNRLPKLDPLKLRHETDPGEANLYLNPTNLHTHGLLTPARAATVSDPTVGDFVFMTIFNSAIGIPVPQTTHQHGPIVMDTVDYKITIPANHPSGLFWFHPHVHGIALNQVVQGMSGMITIGSVGDNVHGDAVITPWPDTNVRHLMLKEIQVLAGGAPSISTAAPSRLSTPRC
jgi:L-ascorbate oxidase